MSVLQLDPQARARVQAACDVVNKEAEEQRRKVLIVVVIVAILAIPPFIHFVEYRRAIGLVAALLVGLVVGDARREVTRTYKSLVVSRIVKSLGMGLTYTPESSLTAKAFEAMDLFKDTPSAFRSEAEIGGKKENVSYSIHDVRATKQEGKHTKVIFNGLMIRLDFNKNFLGHTIVIPDGERRVTGLLSQDLLDFSFQKKKALVTLENPDFERIFAVYSTNDQEARYLLTPKLMELALQANAMQEDQIRLAFVQNSLYVSIPLPGNRLEAGLNDKVTPESALGDLLDVIHFADRLVDTFQLETRLWSRA